MFYNSKDWPETVSPQQAISGYRAELEELRRSLLAALSLLQIEPEHIRVSKRDLALAADRYCSQALDQVISIKKWEKASASLLTINTQDEFGVTEYEVTVADAILHTSEFETASADRDVLRAAAAGALTRALKHLDKVRTAVKTSTPSEAINLDQRFPRPAAAA